jgi:lipopolysaccharide export system protein LptA
MRAIRFSALLAAFALAAAAGPASAKGRTGGILPGATAKDPVNIDAGKLDYFDKEQKLIYTGSVIVVNGPSTLKASRLIIFLDPPDSKKQPPPQQGGEAKAPAAEGGGASNDRVRHVDADGPVTLVSKDQVSSGDRASYDRAENKVYLYGNVVWTQGDQVIKGEKLVYDVPTAQATVLGPDKGRVKSIFTPGADEPAANDKAPAGEKPAQGDKGGGKGKK